MVVASSSGVTPLLTIHYADKPKEGEPTACPMQKSIGHNFISQLCSTHTSFSEHEGPLSVKCAFNGQEDYEVNGGRMSVDETSYLVLNNGQRYKSSMESAQTVESFCVWYRPNFAEQILASLTIPADRLLDEPGKTSDQPVLFFERLNPHDSLVSPVLFRIRSAAATGPVSSGWLEDQMHLLLERLLAAHRDTYRQIEMLPAVRWSTRLELYRRLYRARDFLDASLETHVSLTDAAAVACLSPHHFLRLFKKVFQETPHQYRGRKRMEKARRLLLGTDQSITDICYNVGFESLGSFSWLFRRRFGLSPAQYRLSGDIGIPVTEGSQ
jgi:AraC-like DNA-binding protein